MTGRIRKTTGKQTLAIDIGGTGLKAAVLDAAGQMTTDRVRIDTPYPFLPETMLDAIGHLVAPLLHFDRVSIGFPGVVRHGKVVTAPHFGTEAWASYPLADVLARLLGKPARLLNDADVQGLGVVSGKGLEVVLTLGTGLGSAVFSNGRLSPHLELAHHPIRNGMTYNEYVGDAAYKAHGPKKWNRRVTRMIGIVEALLHYDLLYLGGGNAGHVATPLPDNVRVTSNDAGLTGGIHLWDERIWSLEQES